MTPVFHTAADAVNDMLAGALEEPLEKQILGMHSEFVGMQFDILEPEQSLMYSAVRKLNYRYMTAEAMWNIANRADVAFLRRYFSGVDHFVADQDQRHRDVATWAYGPHLHQQIRLAFEELKSDPNSRRAIVTTKVFPRPQGTPPCFTSAQWLLRDDELTQITTMRSNDMWLGLPLDLYQFGCWHRMMAAALGVKVGRYTHQVGSMHLYANNVEAAKALLANGGMQALRAPGFGPDALLAATRDVPGQMVEHHGHKMYEDENPEPPDYHVAPGLRAYTALLLGDYGNAGEAFNVLRENGQGIGF